MPALRRRVRLLAWLGGRASALWAIGFALAATVALGLVPQSRSAAGSWWQHLISSWPFVLVWVWLAVSLGLATIYGTIARVAASGEHGNGRRRLRTTVFVLNHLGLLLALVAATLGSADMERLRMAVGQSRLGAEPQSVAWDANGYGRELDIAIELVDFKINENQQADVRTPRKFKAEVKITALSPHAPSISEQTVEVNRPASMHGWKVYLIGYEAELGEDTRYCEFELVRDPWLPWVYAGIGMMLAGAMGLFVLATPKKEKQ
ncbi:MAG: cytochrome c biogenesis protein ResB [Muribaculaceae bacterium]|nr:cytochrome c biogenesis protein ResB [Muribaculaceae bacterium]